MAFPTDAGMQLFVTVKDGKLTAPDPKKMAELSEGELLPPEECRVRRTRRWCDTNSLLREEKGRIFMSNPQSRRPRRFQVLCSVTAAAELRESECQDLIRRGRRYSDDNYFENLLAVWTQYGRQPTYGEMDQPPSSIPFGAYEAKWGT
jgi:hypothetical protein